MPAKRRPNNTGSVFYEPKYDRWCAQIQIGFSPNGRPRYKKKRAKKQAEVVTWLKAQQAQQAQGIDLAPERLTVEQFLERKLAEVERSHRYTTHKGYSQLSRDHVYPRIGRLPMAQVGKAQFQGILDAMHDLGRARNTIRNVRAWLMTATAEVERVYPNAYHGIRATKLPKVAAPAAPIIRALTPEQARTFLASVEHERLRALFWVALLLGLREGEVLGLRTCDLDLAAQTLRIAGAVQPQKGKGIVRVPTKNEGSAAEVPVPDVLVPVLIQHLAMLDEERTRHGWHDHGLLFPTAKGTPMSARNMYRRYKTLLARAELPDIRFHDLRHSCATLLISLGVHPRIIMEILRHSQISTTMNTYGHALPEVNRDAVNQLGELVMPERLELPERGEVSR